MGKGPHDSNETDSYAKLGHADKKKKNWNRWKDNDIRPELYPYPPGIILVPDGPNIFLCQRNAIKE